MAVNISFHADFNKPLEVSVHWGEQGVEEYVYIKMASGMDQVVFYISPQQAIGVAKELAQAVKICLGGWGQ